MNYYAVFDTNVIVSAMLNGDSIPGTLVKSIFNESIIPILNFEILKEYSEVLHRKKFNFNDSDIENLIKGISKKAIFYCRKETKEFFNDIDDIVFYEVALSSRDDYDTYLVTGNTKHFPNNCFVVTPHDMFDIINEK